MGLGSAYFPRSTSEFFLKKRPIAKAMVGTLLTHLIFPILLSHIILHGG